MNILLFLLLLEPTQLNEPEQLVSDFYNWYVNGGYLEMKPSFKELANGMTDMDFDQFDKAHYRFHFSEQLIKKSKDLYKGCRTNLSTIPYQEFRTYQDLDQFEAIGCSFQFWQWFGTGMEGYQYYRLTNTNKLNESKYEITIGFSWMEDEQLTNLTPVTVELIDSKWTITNIGVDWN